MCSPAAVGIGLTLGSAAYTGFQQHAAAQYQEAVQNRNAQVAAFQADDAARRGGVAGEQQGNRVNQIEGAQRAAIGASGVQADTGTTGEIVGQTARFGALDEAQIRTNALREAWGYKQQAAGYQAEGELYKSAGDNEATGTILNGLARAYGMYSKIPKDDKGKGTGGSGKGGA